MPLLELKVTPWFVSPPAQAETTKVAVPSVSPATLEVTSQEIQVPELALLMFCVPRAPDGVFPGGDGAVFHVSVLSLHESAAVGA